MAKTKGGSSRKASSGSPPKVSQQAFDAAATYGKFQAFLGLFMGLLIAIPLLVFGIWALRSGKEYRSTGVILVIVGALIAIWVIAKAVLASKYKGFAAASGASNVLGGIGGGGGGGGGRMRVNDGPALDLGGLINFGFMGR